MALRWYVVHAYSNFEHRVSEALKERIKRDGLEHKFGEILVPTEEVVEMRDGQRRKSERKFYPGYVLVQMDMDEQTWHLVRDVPKVRPTNRRRSPRRKPARSCVASKRAWINLARRCCSSPAKWCVSPTARSTTSMAWSRT